MSMWNKIQRIAKRDGGYHCHYCKKELAREKITLDHKTPRRLGGGIEDANIVLACFPCNSHKGDMPYEEYTKRVWGNGPLGIRKPDGTYLVSKRK